MARKLSQLRLAKAPDYSSRLVGTLLEIEAAVRNLGVDEVVECFRRR
jgi:hypothetical protein